MLRLSSLSLCLLACAACDDAPVRDEPEPEPSDLVCSEIVLQNGRSAIARCPDGARFSWIVDGVEVLTRVGPALVIGGVEIGGDAWPTVTWSHGPDPAQATQALLSFRDRPDWPILSTLIVLESDAVTLETLTNVQAPFFLDAVVPLTAGIGTSGSSLGPDGLEPSAQVPVRQGAQVWLSSSLVSASASQPDAIADQPIVIGGDGRVEVPVSAITPNFEFYARVEWTIDRLGAGFSAGGSLEEGQAQPTWGWRTGAAHGAVVDIEAITAETEILVSVGADPWVVVDGLWAPALGDWRIDPALRTATAGALLGLYWPATVVCPDAPVFEDTAGEWLPGTTPCAQLNLQLPTARGRTQSAVIALESQGIDGIWTDTTALLDVIDSVSDLALQASRDPSLDRILGMPGAACFAEAQNGPFPRSAGCEATLRTLDAPVAAPQVDPAEGARVLMANLDLKAVNPLPLTLTGPPGEARQRLVLAMLGGGPMLIADAPSAVSPDAWVWFAAVRGRADAFLATPQLTVDDWPPSTWEADTAHIVFNFTDAPKTVALDPAWIGTADLFDPQIEATAEVSIPANDVRVFVRPTR